MKFHLSGEQVAIQDSVRGAMADQWPMERIHAFADTDNDIEVASWTALMQLGVGGLMTPEEDGGSGLGLLDAALVSEVLGEVAAPGPVAYHMLVTGLVARSDCPEARVHLPALVKGEKVATIAFDAGGAVCGGLAAHVPGGLTADLLLVGVDGGGIALVEMSGDVSRRPVPSTDRTRALAEVRLDDAPRLPLTGLGHGAAERAFDAALVLMAADALGGAQRCTDMSVAYAKEREQFGQPIGRFQAVKHQLAQMALEVEPARALVWYAAHAQDAGLPDASRAASMAKAHLADIYVRTTRAAIAIHGGIGYTWEYGLHYWFRRSVFDRAYLGSPALHRARAAAIAGW